MSNIEAPKGFQEIVNTIVDTAHNPKFKKLGNQNDMRVIAYPDRKTQAWIAHSGRYVVEFTRQQQTEVQITTLDGVQTISVTNSRPDLNRPNIFSHVILRTKILDKGIMTQTFDLGKGEPPSEYTNVMQYLNLIASSMFSIANSK